MTQFIEFLTSSPLAHGLIVVGALLGAFFFFNKLFGIEVRPEKRGAAIVLGVVLVVLGVVLKLVPAATSETAWSPGFYGFHPDQATTPVNKEDQLKEHAPGLQRPFVEGAVGVKPFEALCHSLGMTCVYVVDWEGRKWDCAETSAADGSRAVLCQ